MNANLLAENNGTQNSSSHGHAAKAPQGENETSPAAPRWELCPEMFQGQTLGWKVVRLS